MTATKTGKSDKTVSVDVHPSLAATVERASSMMLDFMAGPEPVNPDEATYRALVTLAEDVRRFNKLDVWTPDEQIIEAVRSV